MWKLTINVNSCVESCINVNSCVETCINVNSCVETCNICEFLRGNLHLNGEFLQSHFHDSNSPLARTSKNLNLKSPIKQQAMVVAAINSADWLYLGLDAVGFPPGRQNVRQELNMERFRTSYGCTRYSRRVQMPITRKPNRHRKNRPRRRDPLALSPWSFSTPE